MGKTYDQLDEKLRSFIESQKVFFVASAPLSESGHVNLSPKGLDSLRVLDNQKVAYLDLVGSGAETIAHLRENGRVTLLFCAFEGPPKLLRIYGTGRVVEPGDEGFESLAANFPQYTSTRSIIEVQCERIADSCGFGVPVMPFESERTQLTAWADRKEDELVKYQKKNNRESIDGLPALRFP